MMLVLVSCFMHAGWNLACKVKTPSAAFFSLSTASSVVMMIPLYLYFIPRLGGVPPVIWGFLLATGFFQAFYYISLANAYRLNDISLAYPVTRALPVLLVPLVCLMVGHGKPVSAPSFMGMVMIAIGCMVIPLKALNLTFLKSYLQYPFLFILCAAVGTTGYSIVDSIGLELLKSDEKSLSMFQIALFYVAFENLAILGFLCPYVLFSRQETSRFHLIRKQSLHYPLLAGPASTIAYALVLVAMQMASNISYIVAFRQISILIGVILGIVILKEQPTPFKLASTFLIFSGLVLTVLGQYSA